MDLLYAQLHADYAPAITEANRILEGNFPVFHFNMQYGGTLWTYIRAFFVKATTLSLPISQLESHFLFTFFFEPFLLSATLASVFFTVFIRNLSDQIHYYHSIYTAIFFSCLPSFLETQWGNSTYMGFLVLGSAYVYSRLSISSWNILNSLFAGFVGGLLLYQSRMGIIFLLATELSFLSIKNTLQKIKCAFIKMPLIYKLVVFLFLALFLLVEILGTNFIPNVKIHSMPQLKIALGLFLIFYFKKYFISPVKILQNSIIKHPVFFYVVGFLIGFSPEIFSSLIYQQGFQSPHLNLVLIKDIFPQFKYLINAVSEFFSLQNTPTLYFALISTAIIAIIVRILQKKFSLPKYLRVFAFISILNFALAIRYTSYTPIGARYILPTAVCFLFWIAQLPFLFKNSKKATVLILLIITTFCAFNLSNSYQFYQFKKEYRIHELNTLKTIITTLQKSDTEVVLSTDYWNSNQFSVFANSQPIFIALESLGLRDPIGIEKVKIKAPTSLLSKTQLSHFELPHSFIEKKARSEYALTLTHEARIEDFWLYKVQWKN